MVVVGLMTPGSLRRGAKTDEFDARMLAYLLCTGQLDSGWVPDTRAAAISGDGRRVMSSWSEVQAALVCHSFGSAKLKASRSGLNLTN